VSQKKILVVDDSATMRQQVRIALERAGFAITEAVDGQDAAEKIGAGFDGVVCDVHMPRMTGVEFVESTRTLPAREGVPILMLTTEGSPGLIRRAKAAGAKGWIVKPFKPEVLVAAVQKLTGAAGKASDG
jgi:two-component system chemotaxis response regulator CheY